MPTALLVVIVFESWKSFPFAFLFILARLQAVPGDIEEAAKVDGATPTQVFRYILLPQLAGVIALIAVLRFIFTFNAFDEIYLLTGGGAGTEVLATQVYSFLTARNDVGAVRRGGDVHGGRARRAAGALSASSSPRGSAHDGRGAGGRATRSRCGR